MTTVAQLSGEELIPIDLTLFTQLTIILRLVIDMIFIGIDYGVVSRFLLHGDLLCHHLFLHGN